VLAAMIAAAAADFDTATKAGIISGTRASEERFWGSRRSTEDE